MAYTGSVNWSRINAVARQPIRLVAAAPWFASCYSVSTHDRADTSCGRLRQLCRLFGVEPIPVVGTDDGKRHGGLDVVNSIASCHARFIHRGGAKS